MMFDDDSTPPPPRRLSRTAIDVALLALLGVPLALLLIAYLVGRLS